MSGDTLGLLVVCTLTILVIYIIARTVWRVAPDTISGVLNSQSLSGYGYIYGDNIHSYAAFGSFHGIDIRLPIEMPHIYLDSLKAGGHNVSAVLDESQRINLEGDFQRYFNVFVPVSYETIALSILTPDVMDVLKEHASTFDIEIYGSHLRVISNRRVLKDSAQYDAIMQVADVLLKEIEDRVRSWTESNSLESINQDLHVYRSRGVRIMGGYYTAARICLAIWWIFCLVGVIGAGIYLIALGHSAFGIIVLAATILAFVALQVLGGRLQSYARFWSRRG